MRCSIAGYAEKLKAAEGEQRDENELELG